MGCQTAMVEIIAIITSIIFHKQAGMAGWVAACRAARIPPGTGAQALGRSRTPARTLRQPYTPWGHVGFVVVMLVMGTLPRKSVRVTGIELKNGQRAQ